MGKTDVDEGGVGDGFYGRIQVDRVDQGGVRCVHFLKIRWGVLR